MPSQLYGETGAKVCYRHKHGVSQGLPPWFVAGCVMCEAKAAKDPSLRNAPGLDYQAGTRAGRIARGEKVINIDEHMKKLKARRGFFAALPEARRIAR